MRDNYDILYETNEGFLIRVVEYKNYDNVIVEIQDEYKCKVKTGMGNIKKGKVKNPYKKSVYGVGYFGEGIYKSRVDYKLTKEYKHWQSMLQRCYDEKHTERQPSYKDAFVL